MAVLIPSEEAPEMLAEMIQQALRGEECIITVDGEPLISLVPTPRLQGLVELEAEAMAAVDAHPDTVAAVLRGLAQVENG